jgi:tetratricopeptide (TPR) repeat protein
MKEDFYITYTDYYLKQKNYEKAAVMLEKALDYCQRKLYKIRYTYILAQIYQENGNMSKSAENFKKVIKMNPPYEMTFNAKINLAGSFDASKGEGKEIRLLLRKMLKDEKNVDFMDQIYFALGKIAFRENKTDEAIDLFKLSARKSTKNINQKALTYMTLADIFYDRQEYPSAKAYYDTTLQNLDARFENYAELKLKAGSLTNLVKNLTEYKLQDSLQILAKMTDSERMIAIDKVIAAVVQKEMAEAQKKQEELMDLQYGLINRNYNNPSSTGESTPGKWYFYNPAAKSFGQPEFRMRWGNRTLEDNWRRKNKQTVENFESSDARVLKDSVSTAEKKETVDNKSREYYMKNIPLTDEAVVISNGKLVDALYNLGVIYREDLKDINKATESFEELVKRFPDNKLALPSYYALYEIYSKKGNEPEAGKNKDLIVSRFPESPTALMLTNPDYINQMQEEENKAANFYGETYNKFKSGDFNGVLKNVESAKKNYSGNALIPRFELLKALSLGQLEGREKLKQELDSLVKYYPKHESGIYAKELIDYIYSQTPEIKIADTRQAAEEIYKVDTAENQFFILSVPKKADVNQVNFNLINFNLDNFNDLNLGITILPLGDTSLIKVSSFPDLIKLKLYMDSFIKNPDVLKGFDMKEFLAFLISESNLQVLMKDKDVGKYYLFYEKYY